MAEFISNPDGSPRIGELINTAYANTVWTHSYAAVAFVRASGVQHIAHELQKFHARGGVSRIAVGVDLQGSSAEGLQMLIGSVASPSSLFVFHNANDSTFHPKIWLFSNSDNAELLVGSGNLTGGGLYTNYEAAIRIELDLSVPRDRETFETARATIEKWTTPDDVLVRNLDTTLLEQLVEGAYVVSERKLQEESKARREKAVVKESAPKLFGSVKVPASPTLLRPAPPAVKLPPPASGVIAPISLRSALGFVMTLTQTDAGVGQTSRGAARRSPEVFIPLAARDYRPDFWGWVDSFTEDPAREGKYDRVGVKMRVGGSVVLVNMMTWPVKHDFRLRSEALRSAGDVGDILRLEKADGNSSFAYYAEVVPQGTTFFNQYLALCTNPVKNSTKRWGYYELGNPEI